MPKLSGRRAGTHSFSPLRRRYPGYQPPVFFPPGDQAPGGSFNRTLDKEAADMLSTSLLQARLKELNTRVKVEISDSWVFGS